MSSAGRKAAAGRVPRYSAIHRLQKAFSLVLYSEIAKIQELTEGQKLEMPLCCIRIFSGQKLLCPAIYVNGAGWLFSSVLSVNVFGDT